MPGNSAVMSGGEASGLKSIGSDDSQSTLGNLVLEYRPRRPHPAKNPRGVTKFRPEAFVDTTVFERLCDWLRQQQVEFNVLRHEPVYTGAQAAAVRGRPLSSGAKALVMKAEDQFVVLILPADRKLDSKKARDGLRVKSLRFANKEELAELTGLQPGAVPPFGSLFGLATYCDPALADNPSINFNAGDHSIS